MAVKARSILKSWFYTGAKPIAAMFHDWIDSYYHRTEDAHMVGLRQYSTTSLYSSGMTCEYNGLIYMANGSTSGAWNASKWDVIGQTDYSGGFMYDIGNGITVTLPVKRTQIVYGNVYVRTGGTLVIDGVLVIMNGTITVEVGGTLTVTGTVQYVTVPVL